MDEAWSRGCPFDVNEWYDSSKSPCRTFTQAGIEGKGKLADYQQLYQVYQEWT